MKINDHKSVFKINGIVYLSEDEMEDAEIMEKVKTYPVLPLTFYGKYDTLPSGKKVLVHSYKHVMGSNRKERRYRKRLEMRKNTRGFPHGYNHKTWGVYCNT